MHGLSVVTAVSMNSKDIAELVGSRHDNVKRTIERLAAREVFRLPPMESFEKINNLGLPIKEKVYVFSGEQGKYDCLVVVAQLSPEFTAAVIARWQELEAQLAAPAATPVISPTEKVTMGIAVIESLHKAMNYAPSSYLGHMHKLAAGCGLDVGLLPAYAMDAPGDETSSLATASLTVCLATHYEQHPLAPRYKTEDFNKLLAMCGFIERRKRVSSKGKPVHYHTLTEKGLHYGKNITSPHNPRATQPHYYVDKFDALYTELVCELEEQASRI